MYAPPRTHVLEDSDDETKTDTKPLVGKDEEAGTSKPASASFVASDVNGMASAGSLFGSGFGSSTTAAAPRAGTSSPGDTDLHAKKPKLKKTGWIFSAAYYQQFFDVDAEDVSRRTTFVLLTPWRNTFHDLLEDTPDLYGPVWMCATLVFLIAMGGQYASYLSEGDARKKAEWNFDAHALVTSAGVIYGYTFVTPVLVFLSLRCVGGVVTTTSAPVVTSAPESKPISLVAILCAYGYSLACFIPASALSVFPSEASRWVCFSAATLAGAVFLVANVGKPLSKDAKGGVAFQTPFCGAIVGAHVLFGVLVKLWFFTHF
jgi:hypothetical protein